MKQQDIKTPPAYNGLCAFALSVGKKDVKGGHHRLAIDGKVYLFSNPVAKLLFRVLPNRMEKAEENWKQIGQSS